MECAGGFFSAGATWEASCAGRHARVGERAGLSSLSAALQPPYRVLHSPLRLSAAARFGHFRSREIPFHPSSSCFGLSFFAGFPQQTLAKHLTGDASAAPASWSRGRHRPRRPGSAAAGLSVAAPPCPGRRPTH